MQEVGQRWIQLLSDMPTNPREVTQCYGIRVRSGSYLLALLEIA